MNLLSIHIKHKRRIRLLFSGPLAAGAFTTLSYYSVVSLDSVGVSPAVVAAIAIDGNTGGMELALGDDLIPGGRYLVSAIGVPAVDTSVTSSTSSQTAVFGQTQTQANVEPVANNVDALLYGRDIVWTGSDFGETPAGDLSVVTGTSNARAALYRRMLSNGLPWDDTYGAKPRSYVNGTSPGVATLSGALLGQCAEDDRVKEATIDLETDADNRPVFVVTPTFIGNESPKQLTISVPTN